MKRRGDPLERLPNGEIVGLLDDDDQGPTPASRLSYGDATGDQPKQQKVIVRARRRPADVLPDASGGADAAAPETTGLFAGIKLPISTASMPAPGVAGFGSFGSLGTGSSLGAFGMGLGGGSAGLGATFGAPAPSVLPLLGQAATPAPSTSLLSGLAFPASAAASLGGLLSTSASASVAFPPLPAFGAPPAAPPPSAAATLPTAVTSGVSFGSSLTSGIPGLPAAAAAAPTTSASSLLATFAMPTSSSLGVKLPQLPALPIDTLAPMPVASSPSPPPAAAAAARALPPSSQAQTERRTAAPDRSSAFLKSLTDANAAFARAVARVAVDKPQDDWSGMADKYMQHVKSLYAAFEQGGSSAANGVKASSPPPAAAAPPAPPPAATPAPAPVALPPLSVPMAAPAVSALPVSTSLATIPRMLLTPAPAPTSSLLPMPALPSLPMATLPTVTSTTLMTTVPALAAPVAAASSGALGGFGSAPPSSAPTSNAMLSGVGAFGLSFPASSGLPSLFGAAGGPSLPTSSPSSSSALPTLGTSFPALGAPMPSLGASLGTGIPSAAPLAAPATASKAPLTMPTSFFTPSSTGLSLGLSSVPAGVALGGLLAGSALGGLPTLSSFAPPAASAGLSLGFSSGLPSLPGMPALPSLPGLPASTAVGLPGLSLGAGSGLPSLPGLPGLPGTGGLLSGMMQAPPAPTGDGGDGEEGGDEDVETKLDTAGEDDTSIPMGPQDSITFTESTAKLRKLADGKWADLGVGVLRIVKDAGTGISRVVFSTPMGANVKRERVLMNSSVRAGVKVDKEAGSTGKNFLVKLTPVTFMEYVKDASSSDPAIAAGTKMPKMTIVMLTVKTEAQADAIVAAIRSCTPAAAK